MEVDAALTLLGSYGRWQVALFVVLSVFMMFPSGFHTYGYLFQAYTPPHHCKVPNGSDVTDAIPWDDEKSAYSSCDVYVDYSSHSNATMACSDAVNGWDYFGAYNDTIVSEWNFVCDREYLKKSTSSMFGFGIVVGTAFFTPFHDYVGRRPIFLICQLLTVAIGVWNAFVYNYYAYFVVRFLLGFIRPGFASAAFTLACELFPVSQRTFAGIIIEDFWGVSICLLSLLMYLMPNWRHLQLLVSLFSILAVPLFWLLPESIPWLVSQGRLDEAERIIQQAARINRVSGFPANVFKSPSRTTTDSDLMRNRIVSDKNSPTEITSVDGRCDKKGTKVECEDVAVRMDADRASEDRNGSNGSYGGDLSEMKRKSEDEKDGSTASILPQVSTDSLAVYSMIDVLRHPRLRLFLIISSIIWFVNSMVYYGMTLNTEDLAGDRHLNLFLSGLVEIPAYTLSYFIIKRWGRRYPLVGFHVLAGLFLIISQVIPKETADGTSLQPLQITLTMIGKFCITASYGIVLLYASELFPTTVRNQSSGVAAFCGRIGGMIAPFTSILNNVHPWLTAVVYGVMSIVGGLLSLTLPETNERPLPQTIEEIDNWYKPVVLQQQQQPAIDMITEDQIKANEKRIIINSINFSIVSGDEKHSVSEDLEGTTTTTTSTSASTTPLGSAENVCDATLPSSVYF